MSKKNTVPTPNIPPATRRKRGDSPEKLSPTASAEPNDSKRMDIIWDDALESLRIKESDWDHQPDSAEGFPDDRRNIALATIAVKRKKILPPVHEISSKNGGVEVLAASLNRKKVAVIKVAPEISKIEEFRGENSSNMPVKEQAVGNIRSAEKKRTVVFNEAISSLPIVHHEKRMLERQLVQQQLIDKLYRKPSELVMNVETRDKEFQRDVVDRLLPLAEMKGHGFWKGAEFWRQHAWIGGEERGIYETPGQNQRGFAAPIERANLANAIRMELGLPREQPPVPRILEDRFRGLKKARGMARDLEPHTPDLHDLVILPHRYEAFDALLENQRPDDSAPKASDGGIHIVPESGGSILSKLPDILPPPPVQGPSLQVGGYTLRPADAFDGCLASEAFEARLVFECMAGGTPCKNTLELTNTGSTVVFFSWKRLPVENNFKTFSTQPVLSLLASNPSMVAEDVTKIPPLPPVPSQQFYFDSTDGVLLPGAKVIVPIVFKSALGGVFSERWLLTPTPPTMPSIVVNFRGVASRPDIHAAARAQLTAELSQREATAVCKALVQSLVDGVRTPPRPSSPVGAPGRKQKALAFRQQNAEINFDWQRAAEMERLWNTACQIRCPPPPAIEGTSESPIVPPVFDEWDLNVETLYKAAVEPSDETEVDDEAMEQVLAQLNDNVAQLGFSEISAICDHTGTAGRILMSVVADSVAEQAIVLRQALGLPPPPDIQLLQQPRPGSSAQSIPPGGPTKGGSQAPGTAPGKGSAALGHRGSASKVIRGPTGTASTSQTNDTTPPQTGASDLGIIRSPSDLTTLDPTQNLIISKYVDKLQTTSRTRIKDLINSLIDNVSDLADKKLES